MYFWVNCFVFKFPVFDQVKNPGEHEYSSGRCGDRQSDQPQDAATERAGHTAGGGGRSRDRRGDGTSPTSQGVLRAGHRHERQARDRRVESRATFHSC